jgi:hypothetical protein
MSSSRGVYTVSFDEVSFTAANLDYDFFELTAATNKPIEIVAIELANKSEVGDAQEEMIAYAVVRGNTTTGNGTTTTPQPVDPNSGAASFTAKVAGSTPASAGTAVTIVSSTYNLRAGLLVIYPELMRSKTSGTALLCVRMLTALADDAIFSGTIWVNEL